jgi:hypothetical protein
VDRLTLTADADTNVPLLVDAHSHGIVPIVRPIALCV